MSDLMLDVNQAGELKMSFRRNGWNNAQIKTLSEGDSLGKVLEVIKGQAEFKILEYLINCDSAPNTPPGRSVEEHKKDGFLKLNPAMSDLMLDVDQAGELKMSFRRNGWNNTEIKTLSEGNFLGKVLEVIKGEAEFKMLEYLINCDYAPYIPPGWSVKEHKKGGFLKLNPAKISLYLSEKQQEYKYCTSKDLREELVNQPVLNANVLNYFLEHTEIIPKSWKNKIVFFWGTMYYDPNGKLYVCCLRWGNCWNGTRWYRDYFPVNNTTGFYSNHPAALAS